MKNEATIYMPPMAEILVFAAKDILASSGEDDFKDDIFDDGV